MKAGVNTKVNLRIAKKATPEVLFQGKKTTILTKCSCYGISCTGKAVLCTVLVTLLPGVRTHEISFPTKSMCCQYKHVGTEGLLLARHCPAKTHLFSPFTERAVPAEAYGINMALFQRSLFIHPLL